MEEEAPFLNLEESLHFLLEKSSTLLATADTSTGEELQCLLNYRDDIQIAVETNPDLGEQILARIEEIDRGLRRMLSVLQNRVDQRFAAMMKEVYPSTHWWWHEIHLQGRQE